ncbi:peptide ABC transporter permease, partial [Acinetobacter baumannii]
MLGFILRRVGIVIPTFLGITLLVFALIHLIPGNVVEAMTGERGMDAARYAQLMHLYGL